MNNDTLVHIFGQFGCTDEHFQWRLVCRDWNHAAVIAAKCRLTTYNQSFYNICANNDSFALFVSNTEPARVDVISPQLTSKIIFSRILKLCDTATVVNYIHTGLATIGNLDYFIWVIEQHPDCWDDTRFLENIVTSEYGMDVILSSDITKFIVLRLISISDSKANSQMYDYLLIRYGDYDH